MAPPISPGDEAKDWLDRAVADLKMARLAFSADPPLAREGLYHCQQAAEKALKGFLALHDHPFRRTHDLRELGESCESFDAPLREILEPAYGLTEFASRFRYPGAPYEPTQEEATKGLAQAELICAEIMRRVSGGEADKQVP